MKVHEPEPMAADQPRSQVGVSASTVRTGFLWPAMEATVHNLDQFNPSPEVDSHLEWAIIHIEAGRHVEAVAAIEQAIRSNHLEGQESRSISGTADRLAEDLERIVVAQTLGIKALCRQLRPLLKLIDTGTPVEVAEGLSGWRDIHRTIPCAELTRPGVRRELGVRLSAVMDRLLAGGAA